MAESNSGNKRTSATDERFAGLIERDKNAIISFVASTLGFFVGTLSAILFAGWFTTFKERADLLSLLDALGGLVNCLGGVAAATMAYMGLLAWRKQLRTSKYLDVLWGAASELRAVKTRALKLKTLSNFFTVGVPGSPSLGYQKQALALEEQMQNAFKDLINEIKENLDKLEVHCNAIDALIIQEDDLMVQNVTTLKHKTKNCLRMVTYPGFWKKAPTSVAELLEELETTEISLNQYIRKYDQ